ncbi:unnamed protein product [Peronospora effusa]|nr:unnamed protein product [Peronospora effusa]
MYNVLAKKFKGDDLAKILVEGAEKGHNDSKGSARKLLDYQVDKWQKAKRNEEDVFKLLKLDETDENPLESPVFPKWANFVWGRYPDDNPNEMILNKLSLFYKSKNALVGGLDALDWATPNSQNTAARKILEYQFKQWKNKGAKEVFDILDLHQTDSNLFSRPAFAAWVDFVSSKFSNKMEAFETTFSVIGLDYKDNLETILPILKRVYKNDLDKLLSEGTQIERVKPVAEKLQKAVVQRQQDGKLLLARKKIKNYDWEELPPAKRQNSNRPPAIGQNSKSPPGPATTSKLAPASTSKQASDLVLAQVLAPVPDPVPDLDPALDPVSASGPARASASDPSLDADSAPAAERPIIDLNKPPDERH